MFSEAEPRGTLRFVLLLRTILCLHNSLKKNYGQGLQEFADHSRSLNETLRSLNAMNYIVVEFGENVRVVTNQLCFPTLENLAEFIERPVS